MTISAGVAAGFVAGVAIAGGALIWLRVQENVTRDREAAHVAELDAQVHRLELTVARLSDQVSSMRQISAVMPTAMVVPAAPGAALSRAHPTRAVVGPEPVE
jgi:outer membrane murein-binding lipoprotein Lpp